MTPVDQNILEQILKNLVSRPEAISITRETDDIGIRLYVKVDSVDMPFVIGKGGKTVEALKLIIASIGKAHEMNVKVFFLEPDGSEKFVKPINLSKLQTFNLN
jgi:uncharacterized protein